MYINSKRKKANSKLCDVHIKTQGNTMSNPSPALLSPEVSLPGDCEC